MRNLIVLFFLLSFSIIAQEKTQERKIFIYQENSLTPIGEMTEKQFITLVETSEEYQKILEAEKEKRVEVETADTWEVYSQPPFLTRIKITWKGEKGEIYKTMTLNLKLEMKNLEEEGWLSRFYTKLSRTGFPIVLVIAIIAIAL
jgi:hypothetical protein